MHLVPTDGGTGHQKSTLHPLMTQHERPEVHPAPTDDWVLDTRSLPWTHWWPRTRHQRFICTHWWLALDTRWPPCCPWRVGCFHHHLLSQKASTRPLMFVSSEWKSHHMQACLFPASRSRVCTYLQGELDQQGHPSAMVRRDPHTGWETRVKMGIQISAWATKWLAHCTLQGHIIVFHHKPVPSGIF